MWSTNLSESQFNEVQQCCVMVENIFFLRCQRSTMSSGKNHHVNSSIVKDDDSRSGSNNDTESDCSCCYSCISFLKCDLDNHSALKDIKDGPVVLAEYAQSTTAGKTLISKNTWQKRLHPNDFEIKTTQKKLKYQKPTNSATILIEFEAILSARKAIGN
ncbi:hypothetical protein LOAG_17702 [Loa loa]|uniref:Uncharacterized protein n=1 Tax=Loa loa TaxID=7209 RepID=A0A1S0UHS9_LOALO|nr:hypothetical protein LOAG_17702 [Loa loa]EJD75093.1 hypothetical protein LOAG_17702 [Loa loa]